MSESEDEICKFCKQRNIVDLVIDLDPEDNTSKALEQQKHKIEELERQLEMLKEDKAILLNERSNHIHLKRKLREVLTLIVGPYGSHLEALISYVRSDTR